MTRGGSPTTPSELVGRYLDRLVAHDWPAVSDCLADDVVRAGPFGDVYEGREPYLAFLSGLMPTLPGYGMQLHRVRPVGTTADPDGTGGSATVLVELTETVAMDGVPLETAEALVFEVDADLRITGIAVYIQRT